MKKLTKKLMLSILTVALTFIALGTSTFAWFSMNTSVSATGMKVTTKVNNNLLIAEDTTTGTTAKTEADFKTSYVAGSLSALLEPVSTINGTNFFYNKASNVQGNGAAIATTYETYALDDAFDENYGFNIANSQEAYGYIDYAFQLKAVNTDTSNSAFVNVTKLDLTYGGNEATREYAFRVAILVHDMGTSLVAPTNQFTLKTILKDTNAAYFNNTAVSGTTTKAAPTNLGTAATIAEIPHGETHYIKVVVRLWLEGEDTTCKNDTFATLNDQWSLDLCIKLEANATNAVNELNQLITTAKTDLSSDTASSATVVIDGVAYYKLTNNPDYYSSTANFTSASKVFKIIESHPYDVTNQCTLPA